MPAEVRNALAEDYRQVEAMLDKLEHGHLHIAAFGRVSVGKSASLNALLGAEQFATSVLHGETRESAMARWEEIEAGGVFLIDTPGINEVGGEDRETLAHEVAARSDLVLFIVDGDITETELAALRLLAEQRRPLLLVLNKADRYTQGERDTLLDTLRQRVQPLIDPVNVVAAAAQPAERIYLRELPDGSEIEERRRPPADMSAVKERIWALLEAEGKTLAALNAALFASDLSDQVGQRLTEVRRELAERVLRTWCVAKGVAVALNPIPVADLIAAVAVDVSLVVHLSRLYGLPLTRNEAGALIRTIAAQMALVMGTVWAVNLISSAVKASTIGLSTLATAGAQGAVAYYSTLVVGRAAERYLAQGRSWGEAGPKHVVREILDSLDRDSVLRQARSDILARLRAS